MDPTENELQAITNLAGVFTWSGISGALERPLREALGDPARVRELALVPRPSWDEMARDLRVRGPPDTDGNTGPLRDLTLVEKARVESTRRVALLLMRIAPDSPGALGPPAASPTAGPGPPPTPASTSGALFSAGPHLGCGGHPVEQHGGPEALPRLQGEVRGPP